MKESNSHTPSELYRLTEPVFFVGFMGAGKTSVSRYLSRRCGLASVDLDRYLARREGRSAKELFLEEGESRFRAMEAELIEEFCDRDPLLISCGSGTVMDERCRALMRQHGFVVHLQVDPAESRARISDHSTRPYLDSDPEKIEEMNRERLPLYRQVADATVVTQGNSVRVNALSVESILLEEGILCPVAK